MLENIEELRKGVPPRTIVIKLGTLCVVYTVLCVVLNSEGTSSIVHETTHQPLLSTLSSIVETVNELQRLGHKVVLVSSGAIGVGLKRMDMEKRPTNLAGKQALAAIGQGRLIALWDNLFGQLETPIAQVLLTRGDISDVSLKGFLLFCKADLCHRERDISMQSTLSRSCWRWASFRL